MGEFIAEQKKSFSKRWIEKIRCFFKFSERSTPSTTVLTQSNAAYQNHRVAKPSVTFSLPEQVKTNHQMEVRFLGKLSIRLNAKDLKKISGKKTNSLLAYLLYHNKRSIHRDKLMEKFWGEVSPSCARNSLNVAIYAIRRYFQKKLPDQEVLIYKNECYYLNPDLDLGTDVERFLIYWQQAKQMETTHGLESAFELNK